MGGNRIIAHCDQTFTRQVRKRMLYGWLIANSSKISHYEHYVDSELMHFNSKFFNYPPNNVFFSYDNKPTVVFDNKPTNHILSKQSISLTEIEMSNIKLPSI